MRMLINKPAVATNKTGCLSIKQKHRGDISTKQKMEDIHWAKDWFNQNMLLINQPWSYFPAQKELHCLEMEKIRHPTSCSIWNGDWDSLWCVYIYIHIIYICMYTHIRKNEWQESVPLAQSLVLWKGDSNHPPVLSGKPPPWDITWAYVWVPLSSFLLWISHAISPFSSQMVLS